MVQSTDFGILLSIYKKLKIQLKINIILIFFLMSAGFSYHLGLAALLTTVVVCGCTLLYLVIEQQSMIRQMQKSLYIICLKYLIQITTAIILELIAIIDYLSGPIPIFLV